MDYTTLFYWLTVADNARDFFTTMVVIFTAIAAIATFVNLISGGTSDKDDSDRKAQAMSRKWIWWSYPFMIFFWFLLIFTPSKRDALLIVAGGQTLNFLANDENSKQIPSELSSFVLTEVKNLAREAEVELNIKDEKKKVLEEVKELSAEELLKRLKTDETLKDLLLENED